MISAVWGRAPPAIVPPYDPPVPPLCPETDQDSLSVMKTRAASAGAVVAGLSCASDETARENIKTNRKREKKNKDQKKKRYSHSSPRRNQLDLIEGSIILPSQRLSTRGASWFRL